MLFKFSKIALALFLIVFFATAAITAQTAAKPSATQNSDREKAFEFIAQNRYLDAYPLLVKVAATNPTDAEFWAQYGIATLTRSVTLKDAAERKREILAGRALLQKAKDLGTTNVMALHFLEQIPPDADVSTNFDAEDSEVEKALREGEGFFGRGDYDKAFAAYERAYKLDPKSYEAALFAGDTFYVRKMYKQADEWFAKAVAIDADREEAYRYWGDSLENQKRNAEAKDKFVEALIAAPTSRLAWNRLLNWMGENQPNLKPRLVSAPGDTALGAISINPALLKVEDGTKNWLVYENTRQTWQTSQFKKEFPAEKEYRHTLREETAALKAVADAAEKDLLTGKVKTLDENLSNLIKIRNAGLLESYILITRLDEGVAQDYEPYRKTNKEKMRRFINEYIVNTGVK